LDCFHNPLLCVEHLSKKINHTILYCPFQSISSGILGLLLQGFKF
jgi:hypothetical protein